MTVPPDSSDSSQSGGVKDEAQAQAANVAGTAKSEAADVAATAKEQVANVTSDVRQQTKQLADEARGQLTDHASSQRDRAVESLRSLADDLSSMADKADGSGLGVQLAREGGDATHKIADFLEQRDPTQIVDEVRDLARRRPGAFLVGAALAGVVAGRLARGAKSAHSSDDGSSSGSRSSGAQSSGAQSSGAQYQQTYPSTYGQSSQSPAEYGAPVTGTAQTTDAGYGSQYGDGSGAATGMPTVPGTSSENPSSGDAW